MSGVLTPPDAPSAAAPGPDLATRRRGDVLEVAIVLAGTGLTFLVAQDGALVWQLVRVLGVVALTVLSWRAVVTGDRATRAVGATLAGLVTFPIGVGIALPYVAKAGPHPMTFAGGLILVGGAVLLVGGATALVRTARRWWRLPAVAGAVFVAVAAVWTLGQAVAVTNVPPTDVGSATPADRGVPYRDVEFAAADGVTLSGWYVPSENGAAVVLLHGAGSTRSGVLDHAVVLAGHGYGILLYDARGHGDSSGRAMDFGWYGDADIAGAVAFLQRQGDVDPDRIAVVGMSKGGEEAIGAAATNESIRAVVAEGATNRVAGDKEWLSDEYGARGALQEGLDAVMYGLTDVLTDAGPPITLHDAVAATSPRPVLLIAGGSVPSEPPAARFVQSASPDTVTLWEVPDTGHTAALDTHPAEWEARVTDFLDDALLAG